MRLHRAVEALSGLLRISEHFACRVVRHPQHSTQSRGGKVLDLEEAKLRRYLGEITTEQISWGRRMASHLLPREGG